jgi:hypothetical protein
MMKLRLLFGMCAVVALGVGVTAALGASTTNGATCGNETLVSGNYNSLTVTGHCIVDSQVTINGGVTVANGAWLDAAYLGTRLSINGGVGVGHGATLGLGCSYDYHDCGLDPSAWMGAVSVNGGIVGYQPLTMYLDFITVNGGVKSHGGGDASMGDTELGQDKGLNFVVKDDSINGGLTVDGWTGAWIGAIRDTVHGGVTISNNVGDRIGDLHTLDSTEVATNVISGDLICQNNSPPAQLGDSGGLLNTVSGHAVGECASLVN